jgi:hypothetical protein
MLQVSRSCFSTHAFRSPGGVSRRRRVPWAPGRPCRGLVALLFLLLAGAGPVAADETVALRSVVNAEFVRAGVGDQSLLAAASSRIGGWEQFVMVDLGDQKVALRSVQNGKYVRAGVGPQSLLAAVSDAVGGWETFRLVRLAGDRIALQSLQSGSYVRAGVGQQSLLAAASPRIDDWETFTLVTMQAALPVLPRLPELTLQPLPRIGTPPAQPPAATQPDYRMIPITPGAVPGAAGAAMDIDRWTTANLPRLDQSMDRLSRALEEAQRRRFGTGQASLQAMMRPPASTRDLLQDRAVAEQLGGFMLKQEDLLTKQPQVSGMYLPPRIESVFYLPQKEALEPDIYVVIRGSGFGPEPGRVILAYETGSGELQETKTQRSVELLPLHGSWQQAWLDHQVVAQVPSYIPGGEHMGGTIDARLLVVRANGAVVESPVLLQGGTFPVITAVNTDRGKIGCCCPTDTEIWSQLPGAHDYVYWPEPVPYYSWQTPCGLEQKDWLVPGGTAVIHGRRFGSTPGRIQLRVGGNGVPGLPGVQLFVPEGGWSDTKIQVQVENVPIPGYFALRPASIELVTAYGRANPRPVAFGPEMSAKWVSGRRWLEKGIRESAEVTETPDRTAMMVNHVPRCTMMPGSKEDRNEKGADYFFQEPDAPYPQDVRITWVRFEQIDPADPSNAWSLFGPEIWELVGCHFRPGGPDDIRIEDPGESVLRSRAKAATTLTRPIRQGTRWIPGRRRKSATNRSSSAGRRPALSAMASPSSTSCRFSSKGNRRRWRGIEKKGRRN